ncbi:MAG: hypothetical protein ACLFNV_11865, partial [Desulfovibrionales bacterium]
MLFPGATLVWSDLNLAFVDTKELLLFLKKQEFSGGIFFHFPKEESAVLLQDGDVVLGLTNENKRWLAQNSPSSTLNKAQQNTTCPFSVYRLNAEAIDLMVQIFRMPVRPLFKELSSEFTNFEKVLNQLLADSFTGYIELSPATIGDKPQEYVIISNGTITGFITRQHQGTLDMTVPTNKRKVKIYARQVR